MTKDCPRSLADPSERKRREEMLTQKHIAPLEEFRVNLQKRGFKGIPHFDPCDGGVNAKILFLFEKPGPMTAQKTGSDFISRNNDDLTAKATFDKMEEAKIQRKLTCIWNVIPGWNNTIKIEKKELQDGVDNLKGLLDMLPACKVIVLVGKKAQRAEKLLESLGRYHIIKSAHPSPRVRARFRPQWEQIGKEWEKVHNYLK